FANIADPTKSFDALGTYNVHLTVEDNLGNTTERTLTVVVSDAALTGSAATISAIQGQAFTAVIGSFTDADAAASSTDISATIRWGDGQTSPGTVVANGASFNVLGSHTYTGVGTFTISVSIQEVMGSSLPLTSTANVADMFQPLVSALYQIVLNRTG